MKWQEKLAVLKVAGFKLYENPKWVASPNLYYKYYCDPGNDVVGCGDTREAAVDCAWHEYTERLENEKAS